ncbi:MAG: hypothetical protein RR266_04405, partial [Bacilli bacterium]
VNIENETVWLNQAQMAELFQTTKQNISLHINNIFKDGELEKASVVKEYLTTGADGKNYKTKFYNLDVIISVDNPKLFSYYKSSSNRANASTK